MRLRFPAYIVQNEWVEASVIHLFHSHSFISRNACWEFGPRMTLPRSSHFLRCPLSVRLAVVQCHSCLRFSCWNVKWIFGIEPLQSKVHTCRIGCTTLYVVWSLVLTYMMPTRDGSRGVVLGVRTPPKYQTPSNLNTRTAHGPSTVRDGLRIAPDGRRLFVDRQEPEKLLKLPRYSNFGTVCCTGNFKHDTLTLFKSIFFPESLFRNPAKSIIFWCIYILRNVGSLVTLKQKKPHKRLIFRIRIAISNKNGICKNYVFF